MDKWKSELGLLQSFLISKEEETKYLNYFSVKEFKQLIKEIYYDLVNEDNRQAKESIGYEHTYKGPKLA